jgi:mono/diheme cytochrome c family protein
MVIYQQWIARALIVTWIWGVLLGSAVCASADEAGKKVYQRDCQSCHGPDGAGNPQLAKALQVSIPPVTGAALKQKDNAEILHIIAEGKGKMPGFTKKLSAEEQRQVLEYMKTLGQ